MDKIACKDKIARKMEKIACIRGATTLKENSKEEIFSATVELMDKIIKENRLTSDMIASCIFSSTSDIDEAYPASAITLGGSLRGVPFFSTLEPSIKGSLPLCIRVMLTIMCSEDFVPKHIYLGKAANLKTNTD